MELRETTMKKRIPSIHSKKANVTRCTPTVDYLQIEPSCYSKAAEHDQWRTAMQVEISALQKHDTWNPVPRPADANVVGYR